MEKSLARFLRYQRSNGHAPKTLTHYEGNIRLFIQWLKDNGRSTDIDDLDADTVREWLEDMRNRDLSPSTIATRVRALKAFTNWLHTEEWIRKNPLKRLKIPKERTDPKETFTPQEVDKLLNHCDRRLHNGLRDYALIMLLYSTGLRATEAVELRVSDIDYQRGLIIVRRGKGGKARLVPLGTKVEKAIDKYLAHKRRVQFGDEPEGHVFRTDEGQPMGYIALRHMLRRRGEAVGVKANPHKFRHTFAIEYLRNGGKLEALKNIMGHSDFEITLHYARIAGIDLTTAHEIADPAKKLKSR